MAVDYSKPFTARPAAKSQHTSDTAIQPFLHDDFDPADYLNNTLPSLSASTTPRSAQNVQSGRSAPLSEVNNQLQSLLTQLNAQTSRLSNTLTQLTDEIIRSGGRLAYEVEVLRGDTGTLTDVLENGLSKDIELFSPTTEQDESEAVSPGASAATGKTGQPQYLDKLQELNIVRSRLDTVIQVFGQAMAWPLAPSELNAGAAIISISGPDENDADTRSREEKGKEYAEKIRSEINELLGTGSDVSGIEAATRKVEELRHLADIWKGTAEEKARLKFVDGLQKSVDERQKAVGRPELVATPAARKPGVSPSRNTDYRYGNLDAARTTTAAPINSTTSNNAAPAAAGPDGGYGFLQNLRNLKNEMYLD